MSEAAGELPDDVDEPDVPDEPEESERPPPRPRLEVSGTQVAAGALASVSAAVVASLFGAAGTLTGAAVASVVTTVSSAVYGVGIRHTSEKLRQTQGVLPFRPTLPSIPRGRIERWRGWLRQRRWGVLAGIGLVFVATMAVVTLVEAVGQRPLSSIAGHDTSGATSIGAVVRGEVGSDSGSDGSDESPTTTTATTTDPGDDGATSTSPSTTSPTGEDEEPDSSATTSTTVPESPTTTGAESPAPTDQSTPTSGG